jgi:hypothetical protein
MASGGRHKAILFSVTLCVFCASVVKYFVPC